MKIKLRCAQNGTLATKNKKICYLANRPMFDTCYRIIDQIFSKVDDENQIKEWAMYLQNLKT